MTPIRTVRLFAASAALLFAVGTIASAQAPLPTTAPNQPMARGGRGGGISQALFNGITLSAAQRAQLKVIEKQDAKSRRAAMQGTPKPAAGQQLSDSARTALRTERQQMMEKRAGDLRTILTADQQATFDQNLSHYRQQMTTRKHGRRSGTSGT